MDIAIIPARGGSQRIPRKNIKPFCGKPMIAWSVETALAAGCFSHVIVSTDDHEMAEIARSHGAETPFSRPAELATDTAPTKPVIAHAIAACQQLGWQIDRACCLYPCAPFTQPADLQDALQLLVSSSVPFVYPVCEYAHPIQRAMLRSPHGHMTFLQPEHELTPTQQLEATYHDAGQFYWGITDAWLGSQKMHTDGIGMIMPSWRFVDIDTSDDWTRAEILFPLIQTAVRN